jgi:hypothetical protein
MTLIQPEFELPVSKKFIVTLQKALTHGQGNIMITILLLSSKMDQPAALMGILVCSIQKKVRPE